MDTYPNLSTPKMTIRMVSDAFVPRRCTASTAVTILARSLYDVVRIELPSGADLAPILVLSHSDADSDVVLPRRSSRPRFRLVLLKRCRLIWRGESGACDGGATVCGGSGS
jgi:hypothetical protein